MRIPPHPLRTLERLAIESSLDRHAEHSDAVVRVARELEVGRATIYRRLQDWRNLDSAALFAHARGVGVSKDEVHCALGHITQTELARRASYSKTTALRRMREALKLLGRRRTRWGLALLECEWR